MKSSWEKSWVKQHQKNFFRKRNSRNEESCIKKLETSAEDVLLGPDSEGERMSMGHVIIRGMMVILMCVSIVISFGSMDFPEGDDDDDGAWGGLRRSNIMMIRRRIFFFSSHAEKREEIMVWGGADSFYLMSDMMMMVLDDHHKNNSRQPSSSSSSNVPIISHVDKDMIITTINLYDAVTSCHLLHTTCWRSPLETLVSKNIIIVVIHCVICFPHFLCLHFIRWIKRRNPSSANIRLPSVHMIRHDLLGEWITTCHLIQYCHFHFSQQIYIWIFHLIPFDKWFSIWIKRTINHYEQP